MEKSSDFIRNKEFHIVFKGYKPEEVDKFLDTLTVEFDRLIKQNIDLQESLDKLKFESTIEKEEDTDIKKIIQDALVSAHKVAEDIKGQAKREAEELLEKQKSEAEKTLEDIKLKKLSLEQEIILLQSKYDEFKSKINKTTDEIKSFLEDTDFKYVIETEKDEGTIDDSGKEQENISMQPDNLKTGGSSSSMEAQAGQPPASSEEVYEEVVGKAETAGEFGQDGKGDETDNIEPQSESKISPQEEISGESTGDISLNTMETSRKDIFDNYNISSEKDGGYYFDRNTTRKEKIDKFTSGMSESGRKTEQGSGISQGEAPKKERKKIDIANPDIIEDFFKTTDE